MFNSFGAGFLVGRAAATTANPTPTPRRFGELQEVSVDDSFGTKELFGGGQRPLRQFRGQAKTDIKAKFARINGRTFSELFYSGTVTAGSILYAFNEYQVVPAITTFTLTALNAGAAGINFVEDLGVSYAVTGVSLKLVPAAPTVGQYSVSAVGLYTFAAADASVQMTLNYSYSNATQGYTMTVPTLPQQEAPYFEVILMNPQDGGYAKKFFKCSASKLNLGFKQADIMIPELDISVYDPGTGLFFVDYYAGE